MIRSLLVVLALLTSGCVTHSYTEGTVVALKDTDGSRCRGNVIGSNYIVALGHCIEKTTLYVKDGAIWRKATVVSSWKGRKDTVLVLRVEGATWPSTEWFTLAPGGSPDHTVTKYNGLQNWDGAISLAGDSGSPVMDDEGRLVGMVWGHYKNTKGAIIEPLPLAIITDSRWSGPRHTCTSADCD